MGLKLRVECEWFVDTERDGIEPRARKAAEDAVGPIEVVGHEDRVVRGARPGH